MEVEDLFDKVLLFRFSLFLLLFKTPPQRSGLSTCNVRPAETLALYFPHTVLAFYTSSSSLWNSPLSLTSLINLFLNLATCILPLFLIPANLPSTSSSLAAQTSWRLGILIPCEFLIGVKVIFTCTSKNKQKKHNFLSTSMPPCPTVLRMAGS